MNIDKMQAGREMDALIAEMMGYKAYKETRGEYTLAVMQRPGDAEPWKGRQRPDPERYTEISCIEAARLGFFGTGFPEFSTDIAAAWEVVEKLSSEGYFVNVCRFPITNGSNVHIQRVKDQWGNLDNPVQLRAETVPLVICRAALKALEVS